MTESWSIGHLKETSRLPVPARSELDGDGKRIEDLEARDFAIRQNPKTCGLAVRVAAGPWQTLCEVEGDTNGAGMAKCAARLCLRPRDRSTGQGRADREP